jgi:signal peptidase II
MDFKYAKWIWLAAVVLVVAGADQLTKRWAVSALAIPVRGTYAHPCDPDGPARERTIMRPARRIQVIEGYFDLRYSENCGGVFSILHDQKESIRRPFFYLTHSIAALLLFYLFFKTGREEKVLLAAFSVVLGGAVGNVADRLTAGYVVDFIHWHIRERASWPVFNVADMGITAGLILILIDSLFLAPKREKKPAAG